jgi:hypothetical protein
MNFTLSFNFTPQPQLEPKMLYSQNEQILQNVSVKMLH